MFRWGHPRCFDQETLDAMMAEPQVNFTWYVDREHREEFPPDKAIRGAIRGEFDKIWPHNNFHIKHYLYLWQRLHHAIIKNIPIDDDLFPMNTHYIAHG